MVKLITLEDGLKRNTENSWKESNFMEKIGKRYSYMSVLGPAHSPDLMRKRCSPSAIIQNHQQINLILRKRSALMTTRKSEALKKKSK